MMESGEPSTCSRDLSARNAMVERHLPLVRRMANQLSRQLPPHIEVDELLSAGAVGLMQAVDRFEPARGLAFSTFATPRIRGAMLDALRSTQRIPRTLRTRRRQISSAVNRLSNQLGRSPTSSEVADELEVDGETYYRWRRDISAVEPVPLEAAETAAVSWQTSDEGNPDLAEALLQLPDRERQVLALYYYEELPQREIALALGVTESRISQLHTRALARLRGIMAGRESLPCS
jgi:RNA polymerase sigma factor for flagellar operon FliA